MKANAEMKQYLDAANEDAKLKPLKPNPLAEGKVLEGHAGKAK